MTSPDERLSPYDAAARTAALVLAADDMRDALTVIQSSDELNEAAFAMGVDIELAVATYESCRDALTEPLPQVFGGAQTTSKGSDRAGQA